MDDSVTIYSDFFTWRASQLGFPLHYKFALNLTILVHREIFMEQNTVYGKYRDGFNLMGSSLFQDNIILKENMSLHSYQKQGLFVAQR